jgi:outer membrane protein TolC
LLSAAKKIILQKRLVDQEKERFRITENRYQQGLATFLDLNTAELDLTEAETELHKNYITWYKNQLHLAFATGEIGKEVAEVPNE